MHIGVFWGYVAMMEGLVAKLRAEIGRPTRTIVNGGLADLFDEHTDIFDAIAPDLIIQGLALMHERRSNRSMTKAGNCLHFLSLGGPEKICLKINLYRTKGTWVRVNLDRKRVV